MQITRRRFIQLCAIATAAPTALATPTLQELENEVLNITETKLKLNCWNQLKGYYSKIYTIPIVIEENSIANPDNIELPTFTEDFTLNSIEFLLPENIQKIYNREWITLPMEALLVVDPASTLTFDIEDFVSFH